MCVLSTWGQTGPGTLGASLRGKELWESRPVRLMAASLPLAPTLTVLRPPPEHPRLTARAAAPGPGLGLLSAPRVRSLTGQSLYPKLKCQPYSDGAKRATRRRQQQPPAELPGIAAWTPSGLAGIPATRVSSHFPPPLFHPEPQAPFFFLFSLIPTWGYVSIDF